jgi:hypothetical protein
MVKRDLFSTSPKTLVRIDDPGNMGGGRMSELPSDSSASARQAGLPKRGDRRVSTQGANAAGQAAPAQGIGGHAALPVQVLPAVAPGPLTLIYIWAWARDRRGFDIGNAESSQLGSGVSLGRSLVSPTEGLSCSSAPLAVYRSKNNCLSNRISAFIDWSKHLVDPIPEIAIRCADARLCCYRIIELQVGVRL